MMSKAHRFMYGVTSNSGPFTWLDNFFTRMFPFLLNTSTKFSSTLKWKAVVSSLRWVAHRCPAVQQCKLLLFKPHSKWQNSELQYNFHSQSDLTTGATVPTNKDKSNDDYVAALWMEHNHTISDGAEQHCSIPYNSFNSLALYSTIKRTRKIIKCTNKYTAIEWFSSRK